MTPPAGDPLRLLFDWAHDGGRRLALWICAALALHAAAFLLLRVTYPRPEPARISDASLYVLLPGSPAANRLAPLLASADPALFAPESRDRLGRPGPAAPPYEPSYATAKAELVPLPDPQPRILPPLLRDFGPIPIPNAPAAAASGPAPAARTQIVVSGSLRGRSPSAWPKAKFLARPGDQLAPTSFLLAVAPDGRVLHVLREGAGESTPLEDAASRLLMDSWFARSGGSDISWGIATFHWGLDVKREELR